MAKWFRGVTALTENLASNPRSHMVFNSTSMGPATLL